MMKYTKANITDLSEPMRNGVKQALGGKKGVFLIGSTGSGKTHALYAIRARLRGIGIETSNIENLVELLFEMRERFNTGGIKTMLDDITSKKAIFIDDIGAEKSSEWSQEMLYLIVNRAYNKENILYVATNLSSSEFQEKYGDRIFSRMNEMCQIIDIGETDRRLKK